MLLVSLSKTLYLHLITAIYFRQQHQLKASNELQQFYSLPRIDFFFLFALGCKKYACLIIQAAVGLMLMNVGDPVNS